jgi:hypothetical protein
LQLFCGTVFMLDSGRMTLHSTLQNLGKVLWKGMTLQKSDCTECDSKFENDNTVTIDTGSPSNAVRLDATFDNELDVHHVRGNLILDDDARFRNDSGNRIAEYELRSGNIMRPSPEVSGEFFNNVGRLEKLDLPETTDSLITAVFRNGLGQVNVYKNTLTFGMGCLRLQGGRFTVDDPKEGGAEIVLSGDTHLATAFTTRFLGTGTTRVIGGTLRVDSGATVDADMTSPDRGLIIDTNGRVGGTGLFHNRGFMTIKGGTIGVVNAAGGFDATVVNHGTTFIQNGTATVKGFYTNGFGGTTSNINGHMLIDNGMVMNQGTWLFDEGTMSVSGSGVFVNLADESAPPEEGGPPEGANATGVLRCAVQPNQTVTISCAFDNQSAVSVEGGSLILGSVAQLQNGVLSGGSWSVQAGASLNLPGTLNALGPDAFVDAQGTFTDLRTLQTNQGTLLASGQTICGSDNNCNNHNQRFTNDGMVLLIPPVGASPALNVDGQVDNRLLGLIQNQPVLSVAGDPEGQPNIALECDALNNDGAVAPGGADAPGAFPMIGNFTQFDTGVLDIELAGDFAGNEHDELIVNGNVTLNGHLRVRVLPGYTPKGGEQFTILTVSNGTIAGTFDHIDGYGQYSLSYAPTSVTLTLVAPPHAGDTNNDGQTNADDLVNVVLQWGVCPVPPSFCPADLDGSGMVDADDLITVVLNWD